MNNTDIKYGFWFWKPKLKGILAMLAELAAYDISNDEIEAFNVGLVNTNNSDNKWFSYTLYGKAYAINLNVAFDDEGTDIIHVMIETKAELEQKLQMLSLFQCLFKQLELEHAI